MRWRRCHLFGEVFTSNRRVAPRKIRVRFAPAVLTSIPSPQGEADASAPGEGRRTKCKSRLNALGAISSP